MDIFSGTIHRLEGALNQANIKQKVITNNLANVDTPNYKAKKVSFKNVLNEESSRINAIKKTIDTLTLKGMSQIIQLCRERIQLIKKTGTMWTLIRK